MQPSPAPHASAEPVAIGEDCRQTLAIRSRDPGTTVCLAVSQAGTHNLPAN